MTTDVPSDVDAVLTQLFGKAREAFESGDVETGVAAVTTAETVTTNKMPPGELREQLLFGCAQTQAEVSAESTDLAVAAEYVAAMERRLDEESDE